MHNFLSDYRLIFFSETFGCQSLTNSAIAMDTHTLCILMKKVSQTRKVFMYTLSQKQESKVHQHKLLFASLL